MTGWVQAATGAMLMLGLIVFVLGMQNKRIGAQEDRMDRLVSKEFCRTHVAACRADLHRGEGRFDKIDAALKEQSALIAKQATAIAALAENVSCLRRGCVRR